MQVMWLWMDANHLSFRSMTERKRDDVIIASLNGNI